MKNKDLVNTIAEKLGITYEAIERSASTLKPYKFSYL